MDAEARALADAALATIQRRLAAIQNRGRKPVEQRIPCLTELQTLEVRDVRPRVQHPQATVRLRIGAAGGILPMGVPAGEVLELGLHWSPVKGAVAAQPGPPAWNLRLCCPRCGAPTRKLRRLLKEGAPWGCSGRSGRECLRFHLPLHNLQGSPTNGRRRGVETADRRAARYLANAVRLRRDYLRMPAEQAHDFQRYPSTEAARPTATAERPGISPRRWEALVLQATAWETLMWMAELERFWVVADRCLPGLLHPGMAEQLAKRAREDHALEVVKATSWAMRRAKHRPGPDQRARQNGTVQDVQGQPDGTEENHGACAGAPAPVTPPGAAGGRVG
jgi:hypothetical protein